ncbi:hypothetical protein AHAS_Ahas02G0194000 [Arachis hypogaea]
MFLKLPESFSTLKLQKTCSNSSSMVAEFTGASVQKQSYIYLKPDARTIFWLKWKLRPGKNSYSSKEDFLNYRNDNIQEETEETGEVVQDSLEEEVVPGNSFDEVVSTGPKASMINYDFNKTPEENERF